MHKAVIVLWLTLLFYTKANSQDVKTAILNKNCLCKATLLDSIITRVKNPSEQPLDEGHLRNNQIGVKERVDFLNSDFRTNTFSKACEVKCVDFVIQGGFHLGVIDIGIKPKDKNKCLRAIKSNQRTNFRTKALTKFIIVERSHELVIIYSETPYDPNIEKLFAMN